MSTPPTIHDLKQGATNTLNLANKAVLEIADADNRNALQGDVRKEYHRFLQLLERARERVDAAATPERTVWANKTAARALAQGLAIRKTLGLHTDLVDPLEDREDLCFYCARDDQPPYRPVSVGNLEMRVCAACQDAITPWQTPTSEEMPRVRRNVRSVFTSSGRGRTALVGLPLLAIGVVGAVALSMMSSHSGPFAMASTPTSTPKPLPTATPTPIAATVTPTPLPITPTATPGVATPTAIPQPTAGSAPTSGPVGPVLYQADFAHGTPGWVRLGNENWTTVDGILTADGSADGTLLAPITSKGLGNFAVEASIQAIKDDNYGNGYFAIDVHDSGTGDGSGIGAGFQDQNTSLAVWPLDNSGSLNTSNYTLDKHWHLYRLEVRGNQYRLLVDGIPMVSATSNHSLSATQLGLLANYEVSIRSFRVMSLH